MDWEGLPLMKEMNHDCNIQLQIRDHSYNSIMWNSVLTRWMTAGGHILKGDRVYFWTKFIQKSRLGTHACYSTNTGNSVVNLPTLPSGENNLHYLHVSQLKCFYILQESRKGMHVGISCLFLFPAFDIFWFSAITVSNMFLIDESESLQCTVKTVHSSFDNVENADF